MEYQKVKDFLDNTPNQPPKFRTKKWVEINDDLRLTYNINIQLKFNTSMLRTHIYFLKVLRQLLEDQKMLLVQKGD